MKARWVIKIGSQLLLDEEKGANETVIKQLVSQIAFLKSNDIDVILVSSGAIAVGLHVLGLTSRPTNLCELQAAAAIGQMGLTQSYQKAFLAHELTAAQILLTHEDAHHRSRYLNIKSTFNALFQANVVPIVNENDTISFDEIRFGDNDNLGALVANLVGADTYVILTDELGLYDKDPKSNADAKLIREAKADDEDLLTYVGKSKTVLGSGGMLTKLQAARKAFNSGTSTIITSGKQVDILKQIYNNEYEGTCLTAKHSEQNLTAKKQWLAGQLKTKGSINIDAGASTALAKAGTSLLFIGVTAVSGEFSRGEIVAIVNAQGVTIGQGITNYASDEVEKLLGVHSDDIDGVLGYRLERHVIHCDNLVIETT